MSETPARPQTGVWIERTGPATYRGVSASGAKVLIGRAGNGPVFTPRELLQLALAACSAMSSDMQLSSVLGPNFNAVTTATPTKDSVADKYNSFTETMAVDLSALDGAAREKLSSSVRDKIAKNCTVGNTIMAGATIPPIELVQP